MNTSKQTDLDQRLKKAYGVKSTADVVELYDSWADDYDDELLDELGYVAPQLTAEAFRRHVPDHGAMVLDVGCGTGLVGEELAKAGYRHVDGLDISGEMLARAQKKGVYEALFQADLTQSLDLPSAHYDAVISSGTFTHGHVGPEGLDELVRVTKPGGVICFTINDGVYKTYDFTGKFAAMNAMAMASVMENLHADYIRNEDIGCRIVTLQVR